MAGIFIAIRNQNDNALTSIDGIAFIALLGQDGRIISQQTVDLRFADAAFDNLPIGNYTAMVRHERVEPQESTYEVELTQESELLQVTFVYLEPERVLLRVRTRLERM